MSLLTILAQSGNKWIQFGTLVLVGFAGLGNWVATWNASDRNKQEIEISRRVAWEGEQRIRDDVRKQIDDMHGWMEQAKAEFHKGNEDSAANKRMLQRLTDKLLPAEGDRK